VSFAQPTHDSAFAPRPEVARPDARELATMDESDFQRRYAGTPFTRPGHRGMRRNAAAVVLTPDPPLHDVERGDDV